MLTETPSRKIETVDAVQTGEVVGGFLLSAATWIHGRLSARKGIDKELHECHKRNRELSDRISALETEAVTLRKLLPGGEWFKRLGLDKHPGSDS